MNKKWFIVSVVLCVAVITGMTGCAKKNVRHLASDVSLITPEKTTREQVLTYLGQPDEQYEMADGGETWLYYDVKKSALHDTPYIGEKIGDKKHEMVTVTFGGETVETCTYRLLTDGEISEGVPAK
ncbi:MAG: hypothetical protein R3297_00035 [Desulfobulbales bacterium]|nr:hypothetical protein [Desulfobulbales bacterium]